MASRNSTVIRILTYAIISVYCTLTRALIEDGEDKQSSTSVYMAAYPFLGQMRESQLKCIKSLAEVNSSTKIIILGNHPSFRAVLPLLNDQVKVHSSVDCTTTGIPLFNSMLDMARNSGTTFSSLILPETDLSINGGLAFEDLATSAERLLGSKVMLFASFEVKELEYDAVIGEDWLSLHEAGFWMWRNSEDSILNKLPMLPFAYQRGGHDPWFAKQIIADGSYTLVDVSELVVLREVKKVRALGVEAEEEDDSERENILLKEWNSPRRRPEEIHVNRKLAEQAEEAVRQNYERNEALRDKDGKIWKLKQHSENGSLWVDPVRCSTDSNKSPWACHHAFVKPNPSIDAPLQVETFPAVSSFEEMLPKTAHNKMVIMVAVTSNYIDMLMSFVCNLRRLNLPNPLVVALDKDIYRFALQQGLAVVYENSGVLPGEGLGDGPERNLTACNYNTDCFRHITKSKSRLVLRVLKLGYSVLWSDVDIVWFKDPTPELLKYGPGVFPIQSDAAMIEETANSNLNSGFYFARSERIVIEAFEAIVELAKTTSGSEQPCFYQILCENGGSLLETDLCIWSKNGLRTAVLPRELFPNGSFNDYFSRDNLCEDDGCFLIHNNWILGEHKMSRLVSKGLWYYDSLRRTCVY